jgi:ABC-type Mn2+/Zn2+ transport system permease subunit
MLYDLLIAPFRYPFMQTAALAGVLVGVTCAVLGVYVVLRRMAFIGDAMSHTILPGLVIAYLQQFNLLVGALLAGVVTALGIGWLFTGMFALGILLISTVRSFKDFTHMLFGYILGVTDDQLRLIAVICFVVIAVLLLFHKELELTSFDPVHAQVIGLSSDRMRYLLLLLMALAVVGAIQAVGVVLTSALLVVPAAAASLLTHKLPRMMVLAGAIATVSALIGLLMSYHFDVSSGASIVLTCIGFFLIAWIVSAARRIRA